MNCLHLHLIALLILCSVGLKAQSAPKDTAVTYYYVVNLDDNLTDLFSSGKKDVDVQVSDSLISSIIDTFYNITVETFKKELGLEFLPLNELHGKIKYNSSYPQCPEFTNVKKLLKIIHGYDYYTDYFVNIFSDLNARSPGLILPSKIRPLFAISLALYNSKGTLVKNINLSYKSKKALGDAKPLTKTPNPQQLKLKLCNSYSEALVEVTKAYKKLPTVNSKNGTKWL
jgi:hypothetical protein